MTTWFTSDTHFGHRNIITYCDRPFLTADGQPDLAAMDEAMVRNWNERVRPEDEVWHLGDFGLGSMAYLREVAASLSGRKHLVLGNHDRHTRRAYLSMGFETHKRAELLASGLRILMVHRPYTPALVPILTDASLLLKRDLASAWRPHQAKQMVRKPLDLANYDLAFCGHVHDAWKEQVRENGKRLVNVGVDVRGFRPVTLAELLVPQA